MKSARCLCLNLLLPWLLGSAAMAATHPDAEELVHRGLRHYLATNELAQAKGVVTNALQVYPDHPKLKKLWELLNQSPPPQPDKQNEDQQKQDKQDQDKQNQEKQDQQKQDQKDQDQQKQDQQKQDQKNQEQRQQQQNQQSEEQKDGQNKDAKRSQEKPEEGPDETNGAPQSATTLRMKPEDAIRLLEALKSDEKAMPFRILKTNRQNRVFKDW